MTEAPGNVASEQLEELSLKVSLEVKEENK